MESPEHVPAYRPPLYSETPVRVVIYASQPQPPVRGACFMCILSLLSIIGRIIRWLFGIAIFVGLISMIVVGATCINSSGDSSQQICRHLTHSGCVALIVVGVVLCCCGGGAVKRSRNKKTPST